jgi:hypothetical protein
MILIVSRVPCPSRDILKHHLAPDQQAKTFLEANCLVAQAVSFVQFPSRKLLIIQRLTCLALFFPWTAYLNSTEIFEATSLQSLASSSSQQSLSTTVSTKSSCLDPAILQYDYRSSTRLG